MRRARAADPYLANANARSGAVPVQLFGDIRSVDEAVSGILDVVPVRYHLAATYPMQVRSEQGDSPSGRRAP